MNKKVLIVCAVAAVALIAFAGLFLYNQKSEKMLTSATNLANVSDSQIISLLQKNADAENFMQNNENFKVSKKEILTQESIAVGQKATSFATVYQGLAAESNRYMRIDLTNQTGDKGLITIVDFKNNTVPKAFGILFINGKTPSTTKNK